MSAPCRSAAVAAAIVVGLALLSGLPAAAHAAVPALLSGLPAAAHAAVPATRDVLVAGNNWDGTPTSSTRARTRS